MILTLQIVLILFALYVFGFALVVTLSVFKRKKREDMLRWYGVEEQGAFVSHGMVLDVKREQKGGGIKEDSKPSQKWYSLLDE